MVPRSGKFEGLSAKMYAQRPTHGKRWAMGRLGWVQSVGVGLGWVHSVGVGLAQCWGGAGRDQHGKAMILYIRGSSPIGQSGML